MVRLFASFYLLALLPSSCKTIEHSNTSANGIPVCKVGTPDPDGDGVGLEEHKPCIIPKADKSKAEVYAMELKVLKAETPRALTNDFLFRDFGYAEFPSKIFARKGETRDKEDRIREKTPPGSFESAAHRFLTRLGQQIYQQALLAKISQDETHADNVALILNKISVAKLGFMNDPKKPTEANDNRFLELGWFLTFAARGAHILDTNASSAWKTKAQWAKVLAGFNAWLGDRIDQNWQMEDALDQTPLNLVAHAGTWNWVGKIDTQYGATNRTFSMLEALFRIAALRGGNLGPMKLSLNPWQRQQNMPSELDGTIANLFALYRGYLPYYFSKPITNDPKEYVLKYDPQRQLTNRDPNALNGEPCKDPLELNFKADCLLNKDAYRNDTYHPQMGLASILHILDIAKRSNLALTNEENDKIIKGLRWASFNNVAGITGEPAYDVDLWELAFRFYPESALGPYCKRDFLIKRSKDEYQKAGLAWGFSTLADGL